MDSEKQVPKYIHWISLALLTTSKKMQRKLLVVSKCSLYPIFLALLSVISVQRNLLVAIDCLF